MAIDFNPSEISVLLLFNIDPNWSTVEREDVLQITSQLQTAINSQGFQTTLVPVTGNNLDLILAQYNPMEHIVFNWCESIPGATQSEWLVTDYLEMRGFAFTGADSNSIALAQDKSRIKQLLDEAGVPTPKWHAYSRKSNIKWNRFPAIVKASREHCSEGIDRNAVVMTETELKNRISYIVSEFRQPALVEEFINGRELHVSLWGNGDPEMLPPAEMEFSSFEDEQDRICTYDSKYIPESEHYRKITTVLPAQLNEEELRNVEQVCKTTYTVAKCRDYARIDLRLKDGIFYVIDVNPNADISQDTTTIAAAELAGYTYGEFSGRIIRLTARRHPVWGEQMSVGVPRGSAILSNQTIQ